MQSQLVHRIGQKNFDERFILRQYLFKRSLPELKSASYTNKVVDRASETGWTTSARRRFHFSRLTW